MTYRLRKTLGGITTGDGAQKSRSIPDGDDPPFTKGGLPPTPEVCVYVNNVGAAAAGNSLTLPLHLHLK